MTKIVGPSNTACNIASWSEIPGDILVRLDKEADLLRRLEFPDNLLEISSLNQIADELDSLCVADGVVGIHYCRNFVETIERDGLLVCTGDERRERFLKQFGNYFTIVQRRRLIAGWRDYFDPSANAARDNRIFFNFTTESLHDDGVEPFLYHYGGEVIFMPFKSDSEIAEILHSIGTPMVVKCALDTRSLTTFHDKPWGKVWLSTYHYSVNPNAYRFDVDAYTNESIPSLNILAVRTVDEGP